MKVVMFSGQGAQKMGMGKEFYDNFDICCQTFDEASEALKMDVAKLCFEEESRDLLNQTAYAQPALLTVSIAAYRLLASRDFTPDLLMGLSLGEYTALTAAEVIQFADAVKLVHKRGQIMTEFAKPGGMVAAMGLACDVLEEICKNAENIGFAACANFNTPEQIVLAGEFAAIEYCTAEIKKAGGKAIPLKVSGPFHTPLLADAAAKFEEELNKLLVSPPKIPVISNLTAELFHMEYFTTNLTRHMVSPVRWVECVEKAISLGTEEFIELGCGKTLVNFVKKINPTGKTLSIENLNDLEGYCE